jgi:hypothetical protein
MMLNDRRLCNERQVVPAYKKLSDQRAHKCPQQPDFYFTQQPVCVAMVRVDHFAGYRLRPRER